MLRRTAHPSVNGHFNAAAIPLSAIDEQPTKFACHDPAAMFRTTMRSNLIKTFDPARPGQGIVQVPGIGKGLDPLSFGDEFTMPLSISLPVVFAVTKKGRR